MVFVIKPEIEEDFKRCIGDRVSKSMDVRYAYQLKEDLPEGYCVPEERRKPWGTAHAALAAPSPSSTPTTTMDPRPSGRFTATSPPMPTETSMST